MRSTPKSARPQRKAHLLAFSGNVFGLENGRKETPGFGYLESEVHVSQQQCFGMLRPHDKKPDRTQNDLGNQGRGGRPGPRRDFPARGEADSVPLVGGEEAL